MASVKLISAFYPRATTKRRSSSLPSFAKHRFEPIFLETFLYKARAGTAVRPLATGLQSSRFRALCIIFRLSYGPSEPWVYSARCKNFLCSGIMGGLRFGNHYNFGDHARFLYSFLVLPPCLLERQPCTSPSLAVPRHENRGSYGCHGRCGRQDGSWSL